MTPRPKSYCRNSRGNKHHWRKISGVGQKSKTGAVLYFMCVFCQMVKLKIINCDIIAGKARIICKEVIPSNQLLDEEETETSEQGGEIVIDSVNGNGEGVE